MFKTKRGEHRLNNVFAKFTAMVAELEMGMEELKVERFGNSETIEALETRNGVIVDNIEKAKRVADNLIKLVE